MNCEIRIRTYDINFTQNNNFVSDVVLIWIEDRFSILFGKWTFFFVVPFTLTPGASSAQLQPIFASVCLRVSLCIKSKRCILASKSGEPFQDGTGLRNARFYLVKASLCRTKLIFLFSQNLILISAALSHTRHTKKYNLCSRQ